MSWLPPGGLRQRCEEAVNPSDVLDMPAQSAFSSLDHAGRFAASIILVDDR